MSYFCFPAGDSIKWLIIFLKGAFMRVIRYLSMLLALLIISPAWADESSTDGAAGLLNKVSLRFSAEQYVPTTTALVTITFNASVNSADLQSIQDVLLTQLAGLYDAKGGWHVTSYNTSQDQSGLEKVQIQAQSRLPSSALPTLRDKTKKLSKPGETYTVDNVLFTPSEDEVRTAEMSLRGQIYQQAKDEVDRLNKVYPEQKYYVHAVDFINTPIVHAPMPRMMSMAMVADSSNRSGSNLAVGNKLDMEATVVLAAMPDQGLVKMIH
jgi:hypothetical protein